MHLKHHFKVGDKCPLPSSPAKLGTCGKAGFLGGGDINQRAIFGLSTAPVPPNKLGDVSGKRGVFKGGECKMR